MLKPTNILVPTDFSEFSDKALQQALDIAREYNAKVHVLHVVPAIRQFAVDYAVAANEIRAAEKQAEEASLGIMKNQVAKFPQSQGIDVVLDVVTGVPSEVILKRAEEEGVDLIVIASLGRTGVAKYLIGGVARNVLKGSKCPVLLTK